MKIALLLLIGVFSGIASGLLGVGGGIVMVPAMTLFAGMPIKTAIGTSLAVIIPTAIVGVAKHYSLGNVDWRVAATIAATAIIGGWLGAKWVGIIPAETLKRVFGGVLILVGLQMLLAR
jgi:uncharacterized membrane protein YfcA